MELFYIYYFQSVVILEVNRSDVSPKPWISTDCHTQHLLFCTFRCEAETGKEGATATGSKLSLCHRKLLFGECPFCFKVKVQRPIVMDCMHELISNFYGLKIHNSHNNTNDNNNN